MAEYELVERLTGTGKVFRKESQIAIVRYNIEVKREIVEHKSHNKTHRLAGANIINGRIRVLDGERSLNSENEYVLKLEDRRRMHFVAPRGDPAAGEYLIQPAGLHGLEPA